MTLLPRSSEFLCDRVRTVRIKPATVSRSVASMKAFFHYEELEQRTSADPAFELKAPKVEKKPQLF